MDIEVLDQELTERINNLQIELDDCRRQKVIVSIINCLKTIGNLRPGAEVTMMNPLPQGMSVTREDFDAFVGLLNSNEYLKGYTQWCHCDVDTDIEVCNYTDIYYLTLGVGTVIAIDFCKRIEEYGGEGNYLSVSAYVESQDFLVKVGNLKIKIVSQENWWSKYFHSHTTNEFLFANGKMLNEAISPISPDDLANRYFKMIESDKEKRLKLPE